MPIDSANKTNQILKTVPGTYTREAEGFGLHLNIGVLGVGSERASRGLLLEDCVMVAPASYANLAAGYFPHTLRMRSVEVP